MSAYSDIISMLPVHIEQQLKVLHPLTAQRVTEIHLKSGAPPFVLDGQRVQTVGQTPLTQKDIDDIFLSACGYSTYIKSEQLKMGFVTLAGGHRVGVYGRYADGRLVQPYGVTIRVAREYVGFADFLFTYENAVESGVLVCGAVGSGKTTFLRDCIRILSCPPLSRRVCIIDERSELCGSLDGSPQFTFGLTADFLTGCDRKTAAENAIRALSPQTLVCDELYSEQDAQMLRTAAGKGVRIFATAHTGGDINDARQWLEGSSEHKLFNYAVLLDERSLKEKKYKVLAL